MGAEGGGGGGGGVVGRGGGRGGGARRGGRPRGRRRGGGGGGGGGRRRRRGRRGDPWRGHGIRGRGGAVPRCHMARPRRIRPPSRDTQDTPMPRTPRGSGLHQPCTMDRPPAPRDFPPLNGHTVAYSPCSSLISSTARDHGSRNVLLTPDPTRVCSVMLPSGNCGFGTTPRTKHPSESVCVNRPPQLTTASGRGSPPVMETTRPLTWKDPGRRTVTYESGDRVSGDVACRGPMEHLTVTLESTGRVERLIRTRPDASASNGPTRGVRSGVRKTTDACGTASCREFRTRTVISSPCGTAGGGLGAALQGRRRPAYRGPHTQHPTAMATRTKVLATCAVALVLIPLFPVKGVPARRGTIGVGAGASGAVLPQETCGRASPRRQTCAAVSPS